MEIQIWEKSVISWLNLLTSSSSIHNISQVNELVLLGAIKKIKSDFDKTPVEFLKEVYPNLFESKIFRLSKGVDCLCAATLILIYVSLSKNEDLNEIKTLMCTDLDNSVQLNILEILKKLQQYENFFSLSYNIIKHEIFPEIFVNFEERQSCQESFTGDCVKTPVKHNLSDSMYSSPLQEFFQTPKRRQPKFPHNTCGDGDHLKKIQSLTDLLNEEELEKTSLQEKLKTVTQKCSDYETKLKSKVEEINLLKLEWENESRKNEGEISELKNNMMKILDEEKKRKNELKYYENYVSSLESDISASTSEYEKLKNQLNIALARCDESELQLREATELNLKFQNIIEEKEKALQQFRDIYANFYSEEKTIDVSFLNKSIDTSGSTAENLGVVMDALLREENAFLKKTVEEIKFEKDSLVKEIKCLKEKLTSQNSAISELEFNNKELNLKLENMKKTQEELASVKKKLTDVSGEINQLFEENRKINEQYNALKTSLEVVGCEKLKRVLQINFLTLAEEFKIAQKRLEIEIKKISELTVNSNEKLTHSGKIQDRPPTSLFPLKMLKSLKSEELNNVSANSRNSVVLCTDSKVDDLIDILRKFENCQSEWSESKIQLERTCNQINFNIINLQDSICELETYQKQYLKEIEESQHNLQETEQKMSEMETLNAKEIQKLKEELEAKEVKIKGLECLIQQSKQIQRELISEMELLKQKTNVPKTFVGDGDNKSFGQPEAKVPSNKKETLYSVQQEFDDSLEEIPITSKTFDIVNLEERNIGDRTFSIKKDEEKCNLDNNSNSAWVISPPRKISTKVLSKVSLGKQTPSTDRDVALTSVKFKQNKVMRVSSSVNVATVNVEEVKTIEHRKDILALMKECECLKFSLAESEKRRKKDREAYEKNINSIKQSITTKYENQLEHLKSEMKHLYTKEMAKQTSEKNDEINSLQEQNKRYKEHIDELRNQLWDLGEKLLQEQTLRRNVERHFQVLKEKYENLLLSKDSEEKSLELGFDKIRQKDLLPDEVFRQSTVSQLTNAAFPTIPTEDEAEVFDNRFLEDMKTGVCKVEKPEDRLKELQYRNSLCLPHLKSSYPGETQFHNPSLFKESDLKFGNVQFGQESQSLTDSDHSMTKSLLPDSKGKKKEQTSYRKPGPPTPSKHGGRLSVQSADLKLTPRSALKELYDQNDRNKGTPNPLRIFRPGKSLKVGNVGVKDELIVNQYSPLSLPAWEASDVPYKKKLA